MLGIGPQVVVADKALDGAGIGFELFFGEPPHGQPGALFDNLKDVLLSWMFELQGTPVAKYGLTRVIDAVGDYFFGEDEELPAGELIDTLWSKFFGNVDFFDTLDINGLATTALTAVRDRVISTVVTQIVKWLAPLLAPAGGIVKVVQVIFNGVKWLVNQGPEAQVSAEGPVSLPAMAADAHAGAGGAYLVSLLKQFLGVGLSLVGDLLGLGGLKDKANDWIAAWQKKMQGYVRKAIRTLLGKPQVAAFCKVCEERKKKKAASVKAAVVPPTKIPSCGQCFAGDVQWQGAWATGRIYRFAGLEAGIAHGTGLPERCSAIYPKSGGQKTPGKKEDAHAKF